MTLDEVEVYLLDADDFDVRLEDYVGDQDTHETRPTLWWQKSYTAGGRTFSGWMLAERADIPRDHFFGAGRNDLAYVAAKARATLRDWAEDTER